MQRVKRQRAGHHDVVVAAALRRVRPVGQLLIREQLVARLGVALGVGTVAHGRYQLRHHKRLRSPVGVETYALRPPPRGCVETFAAVQVAVAFGKPREHEQVRVAPGLRLQRVAFYYHQRAVVVAGYVLGVAHEQVVIGVAAPLRHHLVSLPRQPCAPHHGYHRPVRRRRAPAYVHRRHIARPLLRVAPHAQAAQAVVAEAVPVCLASPRLHGAVGPQAFHSLGGEHAAARVQESFRIGRRKLGHHLRRVGILRALAAVPVYLVEAQPRVPQHAFVGVHRRCQPLGVGRLQAVNLDFVPRHEHGVLVAVAGLAAQPFGVEIRAHAVGRALHHYQRVRD